jgi:CheY-like chemotaxis protein
MGGALIGSTIMTTWRYSAPAQGTKRHDLIRTVPGAVYPEVRAAPGLRALVVDDAKNIRCTLALYLESLGCQVSTAGRSEPAVEALRRDAFDIAFVDLRLGAENGLDLIARLHALSPPLAIVLITAFPSDDATAEALRRGARACLHKPFLPRQVDDLVLSLAAPPAETAPRRR